MTAFSISKKNQLNNESLLTSFINIIKHTIWYIETTSEITYIQYCHGRCQNNIENCFKETFSVIRFCGQRLQKLDKRSKPTTQKVISLEEFEQR